MEKKIKVFMSVALTVLFVISLSSFLSINQQDPWEVPADAKAKKNPVSADAGKTTGKSVYMKNCMSCHGKMGLGDGPKSRTIETFPGDFSKAEFQSQTDGELFYKTVEGRGDMPKYKGKIDDEDLWAVVHYMRTFKK